MSGYCRCREEHSEDFSESWHGTRSGKIYHLCGCFDCKKADAEYRKKYRESKKLIKYTGLEPWHGTYVGYTNHQCKCLDCKRAKNSYTKNRMSSPQIRQRSAARRRELYDINPEGQARRFQKYVEKMGRDVYNTKSNHRQRILRSEKAKVLTKKKVSRVGEHHLKWKPEDDLFILVNWTQNSRIVAFHLGRSQDSIRQRKALLRKKGLAPQ